MLESCCSHLDWSNVNQSLTHHPDCRGEEEFQSHVPADAPIPFAPTTLGGDRFLRPESIYMATANGIVEFGPEGKKIISERVIDPRPSNLTATPPGGRYWGKSLAEMLQKHNYELGFDAASEPDRSVADELPGGWTPDPPGKILTYKPKVERGMLLTETMDGQPCCLEVGGISEMIDAGELTWVRLDTSPNGFHVKEPYGAMLDLLLKTRGELGF